jgi:hypothetical protein
VLADEPAFFIARDDTAFDVVAFAVGVLLGPPLVLLALEALVARWPKARERLHLVLCAALLAAFALQILNGLGGPGLVWVVLALGLEAPAVFP